MPRPEGARVASRSSKAKADEKARAKADKQALKAEKKAQSKGKRIWKLINTGTAVAAGVVTAKALDATWRTATGHKPPNKPEHPDVGGREAIAWAAISGMAVGVMKTYASRRAAMYWVKSTGRLPPGMPKEAYKEIEQKAS
jgi:hypothetical protein